MLPQCSSSIYIHMRSAHCMYVVVFIQLRHLKDYSHNLTPDDVITGRTTEPCSASISNPVALEYEIPRPGSREGSHAAHIYKLCLQAGHGTWRRHGFAVVTDIRVSCKAQLYSSGWKQHQSGVSVWVPVEVAWVAVDYVIVSKYIYCVITVLAPYVGTGCLIGWTLGAGGKTILSFFERSRLASRGLFCCCAECTRTCSWTQSMATFLETKRVVGEDTTLLFWSEKQSPVATMSGDAQLAEPLGTCTAVLNVSG